MQVSPLSTLMIGNELFCDERNCFPAAVVSGACVCHTLLLGACSSYSESKFSVRQETSSASQCRTLEWLPRGLLAGCHLRV